MQRVNLAAMIAYVREQRDGVVATVGADGAPQAAYLELTATDRGEVVFDARAVSRKIANIGHDARVAVVVGGRDGTTLQYEGRADLPEGAERARCTAAYVAAFPHYEPSMSDPSVVVVRITPVWARHGDYRGRTPVVSDVDLTG